MNFLEHTTPTSKGNIFSRSGHNVFEAGIPVLLIPGMIISGRYMLPLASELASDFEIHIIDLPGFGQSQRIAKTLSVPEIADALFEWMVFNKITRANFVANSFGCQVVADFAARYAGSTYRLILQGPTVDASARSIWKQLIRLKRNSFREQKSVGMISLKDYWAAGLLRDIQTIRITLSDRIEDKLPLIEAPTLVVRGDLDLVVPQEWAEKVTKLLRHGFLTVVKDAAHSMNYSQPKKLAQIVRDFLKETMDD